MDKTLLLAGTLLSALIFPCYAVAQSQAGQAIQEPTPNSYLQADMPDEIFRFCMIQLRAYSQQVDTFDAWVHDNMPRHIYHCRMIFLAEDLLTRL